MLFYVYMYQTQKAIGTKVLKIISFHGTHKIIRYINLFIFNVLLLLSINIILTLLLSVM
jgi:hypothetical protein